MISGGCMKYEIRPWRWDFYSNPGVVFVLAIVAAIAGRWIATGRCSLTDFWSF